MMDYDDFEPIVNDFTIKTNKAPRWRRRQQRRLDQKEYINFCELTNELPELIKGEQISAAKLKGSPEYIEKVNKMAERRAHVRTHAPDMFDTNIIDLCTDDNSPTVKRRKLRPYDKPCKPIMRYIQDWPHSGENTHIYMIIKNLYIEYEINS